MRSSNPRGRVEALTLDGATTPSFFPKNAPMIFNITTFTLIHVRIYVIGIVATLYMNVFVLFAQLFRRIPALIVSAPTQKEPPFLVTQLIVLALFIWLGRAASRGFSAQSAAMAEAGGATMAYVPH
jgi:hypothetical protein